MPFTLRSAVPADIPAMYRLDLLCFDPPFRFDMRSMRKFAGEPKAIVVVAELDGELAGFILVNVTLRQTISSGYLTTLDVHPDHRRKGLALELLEHAQQISVAEDIMYLRLHVFTGNEAAIAFYEKHGFQRLFHPVRGFYGDGLDAWIYLKHLLPRQA